MLTDTAIRKAKPQDKPFKLTDGKGLYLHVMPNGSKLWRMKFSFAGKEKLLSFGPYPEVTLAEAREKREEARATLRDGRDPSVVKRERQAAAIFDAGTTFEVVAREWHAANKAKWTDVHCYDVLHSLERDVFPELGALPIKSITAPMVLGILRAIESRPAKETARRIRQRMSAVFVYGIASGRAETDPAAIVQGAMAPLKKGRQPAITDLEQAREILRKVDREGAHPVTKLAIRLLALTSLRPGALAATPWSELEDVDDLWTVPAARMKMMLHMKDNEARDHLVPLSRQARDVIEVLRPLTGRCPYVFPNGRHAHKPMSENAMGYLLNRAGYHHRHVPHGWRSTFSTVMNERYPADHRIIDLMLAHTPKDKVESAYNRASHLKRRAELAQDWADLLMVDQMPLEDVVRAPRRGKASIHAAT
ncbi:Prophage CP4-57 integrase [compost metagenome]